MILINKRRVVEIFPASVTKLWNEWEIRVIVLLSLFFQIVLILFGNRRKYIARNWVRVIIWLTYLAADWIAAVSLGALSNLEGDIEDKSSELNNVLWAFWAPFLLLHLGGPDTITAYSQEDNELWLRHLLGLFVQFCVAFYIFLRSWKGKLLNILAIPIFVAGLIKYSERTWVLRSASSTHFRDSMLPRPDPGPNYAKFMDEFVLKKREGYNVSIRLGAEISKMISRSHPAAINNSIPDAAILQDAYYFFNTFKRLFADLILSFQDRRYSQSFFQNTSWEEAFKVIEIELGFMYDVLYTKAIVIYSRCGFLLRFISLSFTVSACIAFSVFVKHQYSVIDVIITFLLLVGGIILEMYAIIVLLSSDWTMLWLSQHKNPLADLIYRSISCCQFCFLFSSRKRWSNSMAQYNLIGFCIKDKPIKFLGVQKFFHIYQMLEEHHYKSFTVVSPDLKRLIFEQLLDKSRSASDIKACRQLCAHRGDQVLEEMDCFAKFGWSIEAEFDESILLWHIATDLCYYTDLNKNSISVKNTKCEACKLLSDYMLYLLVMCPFMLPDGIGQIRFQDSCAEARVFFQDKKPITNRIQASEKLLQVSTEILPSEVKGDRSKSVLFDACRLANSLQSLEREEQWQCEKKWGMISLVWVEMLCHAANQCRWNHHATQLRRGGELLTHVWLLMAHFGITEHFKISQGYARAELVVS